MDLSRPSTLFCLGLSLVTTVGIGHYRKTRKIHEFHGTLRHGFACIPEDPCGEALLVTPAGSYELSFARCPEWRAQLPALKGQEIIVRGTLHIWPRGSRFQHDRLRYWRDRFRLLLGRPVAVRRRIRVHDLCLVGPAKTAVSMECQGL